MSKTLNNVDRLRNKLRARLINRAYGTCTLEEVIRDLLTHELRDLHITMPTPPRKVVVAGISFFRASGTLALSQIAAQMDSIWEITEVPAARGMQFHLSFRDLTEKERWERKNRQRQRIQQYNTAR